MKIKDLRAIEGANIYSYKPVINLVLDLENYSQIKSNQINEFNAKLIKLLPSLEEHYCSIGKRGGFIRRLKEGTYLGHIIEHIALELLALIGQEVYYGKTIETDISGVYKIIFEYQNKKTALKAGEEAVNIVNQLLYNKPVQIGKILTQLQEIEIKSKLGSSTKAILEVAQKEDIPVTRLGDTGSLLQLGYGKYSKIIKATISEKTSCVGVDVSCDKVQTKKLLYDMGLPVPRGRVVESLEQAIEVKQELSSKVITKPINGNQGKGVSLNLASRDELVRGVQKAKQYSQRVLVEEYLSGNDYRLLVVDGKVVAVAERIPAHVIGDNKRTINDLINQLNQQTSRGKGHEKALTQVKIDNTVEYVLKQQGYSLNDIPKQGETVYLQQTANLSTGGIAVDCTEKVHPRNIKLAIRAAKTIGLDIAGIDIIAKDISQPITKTEGAIIEVNAAPGIRMHHYPSQGKSRNVAKAIINMLSPARVPIISITGTNGKTTTTRMIAAILQEAGIKVGMAITGGIYIDGEQVLVGDTTGPLSAQTVLRDKEVEVAVLETARGGILKKGLGYDWSDIGIITNITQDHLGQDGVNNIQELSEIKSLVIERIRRNGYAILNADDQQVVKLAQYSNTDNIIYCSLEEDNLLIKKQIAQKKPAVYLKGKNLILFDGEDELPILAIDHLPAAYQGLADHILENTLFAIAASFAYELPMFVVRSALQKFGRNLSDNPGRLNVITNDKFTAIVDYGHNPAGFRATLNFARKLVKNKLIGVIGVPGDRKDQIIIKSGQIAGYYLDQAIIKEDVNLRGREEGEVASLLKQGLVKAGLEEIKINLSEIEAIKLGLEQVEEGDVIVIFYETGLDNILDLVTTYQINKSNYYQILG